MNKAFGDSFNLSSSHPEISSSGHDAGHAVIVPDAHLLFSGEFARTGRDLIISDDHHRFTVPNYFAGNKHPTLVSPEGAALDPRVIEAYTGHTAYAQAGDPASSAGKVVGHVVKITGSASIVRNGVSIVVNNGDVVYQNDLVQTGSNSTLGLVLEDGGAFNLSANSRFMLNELTYDPTSNSNSALLTLVQGAASFVAGQVAKTGDMKVATPVATMGIRGTAVILDISSTDGKVSISVVDQQDGQVHAVQVYNTAGVLIGTVTSNGNSLTLTPTATFEVIAQESNKTPAQVAQEFAAFQAAISTYDAAKQIFPNLPQHTENTGGDKSNNPSPNTQTKFAGSPPLNPPGTEYHPPTVQNAQSNGNVALPQIVVINNAPPSGGAPTSTPTSSDPPPTIQVKASAIPFVVTPPTLASITSGGGDHFGPVMSASGDVVYDPDGAIYFYDRETGTTLTVASPANGWIYGSPTISMDGRYIVYQGSQNGGSSSVFVYGTDPSDATHYHQQTLIAQGGAAAVSGDGNTIVVEQGGGNIAIYDLQGTLKGTITPTAVGGGVTLWRPAISADGHVITFWSSDSSAPGGSGHLYAYNSATHALTEIASTASGAGTSAASVSADGHLIAYAVTDASGHSEVYLYDLNTNHVVFHTANASGSSYYPVLSPDGHFLAFTSDAHVTSADTNAFADIYIVDVTNPSSPQYKLVSEGNASATNGGVAISAGGQYVAFGSASQIFLADPTSGKSAIILETASSPDILTAHGSITLTGDFTGVGMSITDAAGNPAPNFTATFDSSGHINWTFSEAKSDFSFLSYGEDATQQFVIKLSADNGTLTIPVFVTVHDGVQPTIPPTDAAPIANPVTLAQSDENTPHTITAATLLAGVTDIDGPFPLAITALSIASGGGSLVHNDDGSWTYTPAENYSGPVKFNYTASDGTLSASSTASLNISAVDQPPVAGAVTLAPGAEDTAYTINPSDLLAGVSDPDGPFPLSITALSIASGGGNLVHNDDGTWTYTPAANYNGPVSFNYTASDGTLVSSATASLNLAPVNDAPTIAGGSVVAGTVDVPVTTGSSGSHTAGADTILNAGSGLISGLNGHSGYGTLALPAGDDNSSNAIDITSVFGDAGINFFGHSYTSLYVNNNGNITFNGPNSTFTPSVINAGTGNPIIAPFWADVDTRGAGHVYYDLDTVDGVMTITWDHVGYYSGHTDRLNSFQVVLVNEGGGNFDIVYRYADIQWTTGDVSGGQAARAGYSAGDGTHYFELPASGNVSALLALPATEGNTHVNGVDEFDVRNGEVGPPSLTTNGTINFADVDPNDTHSIQSVTYTGSGDALGTLHFTKVTDATGGATGQFSWTYTTDATAARTALDALPDHSKTETFNVVITDGDKTVTQTITVTLNETGDHAPVASAVALAAGTEDTSYTVHASDLLAGVTDSDGPSPLSISALSVAGGGGTLTDHHDGTWTYTPATDYNGPVSFNYTASDGILTASSTASLNLAAVDDAPVAIPVTLIAGTEDTAYTIHASALLAGVTDVDGPFPLSISALSVASGGGTLVPHDDGTWTYTPAANYNGPVSFNYTASDGTLTSSSTASLTLTAADDAPSTSPVTLADGTEDNAYTIHAADLLAGVTDVDGPFPLSISALSVASGGGNLVTNDDGTWTYTPAPNYNGPVTFNYTASDGTLTSSSTASLNLAAVNDAPQATAVTLANGTENASYTITSAALLAGVTDVDGPFPLSISALGVASGGGSLADNGDGTWTYTPANNFAGSVSFNYTASDGSLTSSSTAGLTLAEVALQPVLAVGSSTTLNPTDGSAIKATFALHSGDVLTFDWDFAGHDYMPYNDFSFVTVNGQSHLLGLIQSVGNYGTTGWKTFSYLAPADGGYTIGIGQFNVIDQALNSHTFVDNVRINGTLQTSFEGALTPFASLGSVSITPELTDSNVHIVPTDGVDMVLLDSSYASVGSVESFLGLASGSIAKVATPSGLEHTPIVVPISITTAPGAHPDSTFATISGFPPGSIFNFGSFDDATNTWKVDAGDLGGGLTITTPEGFTGQFTLSVTATSIVLATGTSATTPAQTLSIGVDAPPDSAPVASPVTLADGTEDTAYTINASDLLAGVTDTDGPFPLTVTALTIASGGGSLVDNDDGTWTYHPAADANGPASFSYTASDGTLSSSSTASLNLAAVNDAPSASPVTLADGSEDTAYTIHASDLLGGVTDVDGPFPLSITALSVASGGGSLVAHDDGTWTYTPAANYSGPVNFSYTASDGTLTSSSTANLNLAAVNDAPSASPVTLAAGTEDTAYTIHASDLLGGVTDVDGPLPLSITSLSVASGGGSLVAHDDGTWTYTPAANYNGPVSFSYTASDGTLTSSSTAGLNLAAVDDAPSASAVTLAAGTEDTAYTIHASDLLGGVTDADGPFPLSITALSVVSGGGSLVAHDDGTWTYTPAANYNGPVSFSYTASDGTLTSSSTASLNLAAVDDAPSASAVTLATGTEDTAYTIHASDLLGDVTDVDGPFPLSITALSVASGGGSLVAHDDGTWTYTPAANYNGPVSFSYTASDGTLTSSSTASLTLAAVNDPPTGLVTIDGNFLASEVLTANTSTLADADGLGTLAYQWQRDGADIALQTGNTYTLTGSDVGHSIDVVVHYTDGRGTAESVASAGTPPIAAAGIIAGNNDDNTLTGTNANDALQGFGGDDTIIGLDGVDRAIYTDATGHGITVNLVLGTVTGPGVGSDTLVGIESIQGSNFADDYKAFDAPTNTNFAGTSNVPGVPAGFNSFEGMAGDDVITGNVNIQGQILTRISYLSATAGVNVNLATGVASGNASVGTDHFTNVNAIIGSNSADTLSGSNNPNGTYEQFEGRDGDDVIDGRGGYDFATYNNDPATTSGISVDLAGGKVYGDASIGTDTLKSVEGVRGTNFDDTYDATNFSGSSTNAGSNGTFNNFDGVGGDDTIIGNGNTRIQYTQATDGVNVNFVTGIASGDSSVGTDHFSGVNAVMGSMFNDIFVGSNANENIMGLAGDDSIDGSGGFDTALYNNMTYTTGGITVDMAAGTVDDKIIGDHSSGHDTLRLIEAVQGTAFADSYDATHFGQAGYLDPAHFNVGNFGNYNQFEGLGGDDSILGNGNTRVVYQSATSGPGGSGVTIHMAAGTADGNASVGHDTFSAVNGAVGSNFNDAYDAAGFVGFNEFVGLGGSDQITGNNTTQINYSGATASVTINMLAGTVDGNSSVGHDTFTGVSSVVGSNYNDVFNATGFIGPIQYVSFAGNDQITGNGETQLAYWGATSGVTADLATGTVDKGASGQDTFTGVRSIQGSNFADTLRGDAGDNGLFGSAGEDVLDGRGGTDYLFGGTDADTFVYGAGYGTDTIADFLQSDGDKIDLRTVPNVHAFADLNVSQSGLNTLIDFGSGNTLTLLNLDHTLLGDGDFLFTPPDAPPSITGDFSVLTVKGGGVALRGIAAGTSTADLVAVDADNPPEQLVYNVTGTQHGHLAYSLTGPAITSFTQAEVNARAVFFVSDDTTYVGGAGFTVTLSDGTITTAPTMIGATIVDAQLSVQTAGGFDFDQDNPITAMGLGIIADGASDKTFKIENQDANRDFTFTGTGFTYAGSGSDMHLTGGIITAIAETGHGTPPQPAFSRFDLYVPAVEWMNAVSAAAHGDQSVIETLTRSWTFNFNGNAGPDGFGASNLNDIFTGNGGDDTFEGDFGYDRAYYGNASAAVNVQLADGFVTGAATGTDTLKSIELVTGSDFADLYNAGSTPNNPGGFSAASTNSGSTVTSNTLGLFNEFEGRGGDDQIYGNGQTRVSYYHATSAVTVTFTGWTNAASGSTGFADGDASVGHDTLSGVNWARGSFFDDIFHGATNPSGSTENFEGLGGDDLIDGGGGFDRAVYIGAFDDTGINVQLAKGIVTGGPTTGTDTLLSVEAIRGTGFDDFYDAGGFTTVATADNPNAGNASFITVIGTERAFNEFEGEAGNDTVIGNGNTRVAYYHATAGVVVTLGNNGNGTADGDASIGHDTFISGVRSITGGEFNDILTGNGGGNVLDGRGGNDILDGRASNDTLTGGTGSDIFVYSAGGGADRITDLNPGDGDRVDLRGVPGIYSLADVLALATTNGPDTVITFSPGNSITLANTAPANLVASEFIFAGPPGFVSEMSSEGGLGVRSEHISSAPVTFHMQLSAAASGVLTILANDVENGASPEIDNVFINGHALGQLSQVADGADSTSIFTIDPSLLVEGDNLIQVANANTTPGWNFTVISAQFQSATTGFSSLIVPDDVARQNSSTPAGNISVRSAWTASHQNTFTLTLPNSGTLKNVALTLHANDVELPGASPSVGEIDQVFVNGHSVGFLTQAPDTQNSVTVLSVDSSFLVSGNNIVSVYNVNTDGPGTWNFQIDQLSFTGGVSTAAAATPPSVAVTVQASDGYDFSTVSADLIASAISSSASTSDHIFLVDAAKGITFEMIGTGFTYNPDTHQPTGGTINEIDILDSADPSLTGQDHVLANSNGWSADAATLFSAINQAKSPVAETSNFGKAMLNSLLTSPIFSYVGSRGSDDHDGAPHDGADVFVSGKHADVFNGMGGAFGPGDPGSDTVSYAAATAGVTASLSNPAGNTGSAAGDIYISIENLRGTSFDDVLTGDGNNNTLEGGAGHNVLDGGSGGIDTASYEHAPTQVNVNLNLTGMQPVASGMFDQFLNIEGLRGSSYDDTLAGNGNSILEGGPGDDNLNGKPGGSDTASYEHAPSGVQVDLAISGPQDTGGAGTDKLSHIANLMGSQFNDTLAGDANDNMLTGNGGNDTFVFREFSGGIGHDIIQDFITDTDHIQLDYAAFDSNSPASFTAWLQEHATQQENGDLLIDLDVNGPDIDTILLRNTSINSLRANDFILPAGGGGVFA